VGGGSLKGTCGTACADAADAVASTQARTEANSAVTALRVGFIGFTL
jgi:hypothetical protein